MKLIVAVDKDYGIAKDGIIPWKCPEDQRFFKLITTGGTVVMGRKTADTLVRALPNRENLVMSKSPYNRLGFTRITEEDLCHNIDSWSPSDLFVIGGKEIYDHCIENKYVDCIYMSYILGSYGCDTFLEVSKYPIDLRLIAMSNISDKCIIEKYKVRYIN